jgi:hypothetical protein
LGQGAGLGQGTPNTLTSNVWWLGKRGIVEVSRGCCGRWKEEERGHLFGACFSSASVSSSAEKPSAGGGALPKKVQGRRRFVSSASRSELPNWEILHIFKRVRAIRAMYTWRTLFLQNRCISYCPCQVLCREMPSRRRNTKNRRSAYVRISTSPLPFATASACRLPCRNLAPWVG